MGDNWHVSCRGVNCNFEKTMGLFVVWNDCDWNACFRSCPLWWRQGQIWTQLNAVLVAHLCWKPFISITMMLPSCSFVQVKFHWHRTQNNLFVLHACLTWLALSEDQIPLLQLDACELLYHLWSWLLYERERERGTETETERALMASPGTPSRW